MKKLLVVLALIGALSLISVASAQLTPGQTWGSFGNGNGQFYGMSGVATDASGNIYVAELDNRVQKFSGSGVYITQFNIPARNIAIDSSGNIYATVNDSIQKFNSAGTLLSTWGSTGTGNGQFNFPTGIALDSSGNIYISDTDNNRIQKLSSSGTYNKSWGTIGSGNGSFKSPVGITVSGNYVYVADMGNYRIQKFNLTGTYVSSLGSNGTNNTQFNSSIAIANDSSGNIYVADYYNGRVSQFDSNFTYITQYTGFSYPTALVMANNNLYVLDSGNYRVANYTGTPIPITPTITWSNPADITYGTALSITQLNAVATDPTTGAPVFGTYTYTPASGTVLGAGNQQRLNVDFTPTDTSKYNTATANVTINVIPGTPVITWSNPADTTYPTALNSTQLNAVASVSGTFTYNPVNGTVLSAGTHRLNASFVPNDTANYTNATANVTINIGKATPTVTWSNPADILNGTALSSTQLNAIASVLGNFTYNPVNGTVLGVGTQKLNASFVPNDTANYTNATENVTITVSEKILPVANFTSNVASGIAPLNVQFNDLSENATSVSWDFDNNGVIDSSERNPIYTYANPGVYTVDLVATNDNGTSSKTATITVSEKILPVANFTSNATSGIAPLNVQFNDLSENATSVSWDFDNNGVIDSSERNPIYTYATPGVYTVDLVATNDNGTSSKTATITVSEKILPVANFTSNVTSGIAPLNVQFNDLSENATSVSWDFDNNGVIDSSERNPIYTYATPGVYTVDLVATNDNGTSSKTATITVSEKILPVANFTSNATSGIAPLNVQFNDLSENATSVSWDFDNNGVIDSSERNPIYTYATPGVYTVDLVATNDNGTSSKTATITVSEKILPVANFTSNVTSGIAPLNVQFNDLSENATSVSWDFDNNGVIDSSERNPIYTYATPGVYTVDLTATNDNGTSSKTATITVSEKILPVANFTSNATSGIAPLNVQFNDLSENATSVSWDFDNNGVIDSSERNPIYTYANPGVYTVDLTATNDNGTSSKTATITVSEKILPVANFTSNATSGIAPLNVQFNDLSENATSVSWDFDNNGVIDSSERNPIYTYANPGVYTVDLTATNDNGTSSKTATITVSEKMLPVANFTSNVTSGIAPLNVQFNDLSENATSVSWDFDNNGVIDSSERNPIYTYANPGVYTVDLVATNDNGTNSKTATITVSEKILPVANFTSNVTSGIAPLTVQFNDLSENATSVSWDFDNNGVIDSSERNPIYTYATPGVYTVDLTATNDNGTSSKTATITVSEKILPVANFTSNVTSGIAPLNVQFNDLSENATSVSWDFDNNGVIDSSERNPINTYANPGVYIVKLTATNDNGTSSKTATITVSEKILPVANFTSNVTSGIAPLNVQFNDLSENATSVSWDFDNNGVIDSSERNPIYTYVSAGFYTVDLIATNTNGTSSKNTTIINVSAAPVQPIYPVANFTSNVTSGIAPLTVQFTDLSQNATSVSWDFDSNGVIDSSDRNPIYTFTAPVTYTVNLTAINANGTNSKTAQIFVPPSANANVYYGGTLSGNSLVDFSGNNNNGYATRATQGTNQNGPNYVKLNGSSSKIDVSNNAQTNISSPMSVEFIGSINAFSSNGALVSKYNNGVLGWYLKCSPTSPYNKVRFGAGLKSGTLRSYDSNIGLVAGQVYDIVVTYDNNTSHIYVNGTDSGSSTWNSPIAGNANNITIGYGTGLAYCNCNIYIVKLYKRSLPSAEVLQNYYTWKNMTTPTVTWSNPADITYGTPLSGTQLNAAASVPGAYAYTPTAGTVLSAGLKTLHVDFIPTDTAHYYTTSKNVTINVSKAPSTVNWSNPGDINDTTPLSNTQLNAIASVNGTYLYTPGNGTVLNKGTQTLHVDFTPTDAANYTNATADVTINVNDSIVPHIPNATVYYEGTLSGNSVVDLSGNNNNGSATRTAQGTNQNGPNYVRLNGSSSKIDISNNAQTNISSPISIEFIGSINAFSRYGALVSKYNNGALGWYLSCSPTSPYNKVRFGAGLKSGSLKSYDSNISLVAGQVYDIVVTYDNNVSHIYVNGTDSGSSIWNSPIAGLTNNVTIGYGTGLAYCNCNMYSFKLYNRSLSSAEVWKNYNDFRNKTTPTITWSNPDPITYPTPLSNTQLNAVASVPGSNFAYNPAAGTVLGNGTWPLHVDFTPTDTAKYYTTSMNVTINVSPQPPLKPVANFSSNATSGPASLTVQFTDLSENATSVNWDFDNNGVIDSSDRNPIYTYTAPGIYTVSLNVSNAAGYNVSTKPDLINVTRPKEPEYPVANFVSNVTSGPAPLSVQFNDTSTGTPTSWSWNFGDGQTSTTQNPIHTYSSAGTYPVSLNVSNAVGNNNILTKPSLIIVTTTPVTNGLAAYYNGNLSGNSLVDISGNNNNGYGTKATQGTSPITGANYVNLNGSSTKIDISNNAQTNISSPMSIEFIGSINAFSKYGALVSKYNGGSLGWYLSCSASSPYNKVRFGAGLNSGSLTFKESNIGLVAGQVYDIVATYDNNTSRIYVDGVDSGSGTWNSPIAGNTNNVTIGYGSGLAYCNCSMYTVRLYNKSLSSAEVLQNYHFDLLRSKLTPTVSWSNPSPITYGTVLSETQLNAAAPVPGSFVYYPVSGTILGVGTQILQTTFTPTDTANYTKASSTVLLTVN